MITNEEVRKAIEKYQKEHPLHFGTMIDVTAIDSKEGVDVINNVIEQVSKKVDEDTELWCICEMAKMYMQGVRPVYPVKRPGEWELRGERYYCSECGEEAINLESEPDIYGYNYCLTKFCPNCGVDMRGEEE